jgi:hypothetical protein
MSLSKMSWLDGIRERIAVLREGPNALKAAAATGLIVLAGVIAAASWPRQPKPLAEILTLVGEADVDRVRDAVARDPAALRAADLDGNTPLHIAAMLGSRPMIEALLDAGADVHAKNRHGATPLVAALWNGGPHQADVAGALFSAGASRDERLAGGDTLLHVAAGTPEVQASVIAVLAGGPGAADAKNDAGQTPIQVAERANRPMVAAALRKLRGDAARVSSSVR